MLTVVLILNVLIAGLCWYGTWRVWQLRQALSRVTAALVLAEQDTRTGLQNIASAVHQRQNQTFQLRQQYQQVLQGFQQVRQVLALLGLGQLVWQQWQQQDNRGNNRSSNRGNRVNGGQGKQTSRQQASRRAISVAPAIDSHS